MQQTILVCDVCGVPASATATIKVEGKSLHKDLCSEHLGELVQGARPARPGRRRSVGPAPARRSTAGSRRKASKKSTAKPRTRRARRPRVTAAAAATEGAAQPSAE